MEQVPGLLKWEETWWANLRLAYCFVLVLFWFLPSQYSTYLVTHGNPTTKRPSPVTMWLARKEQTVSSLNCHCTQMHAKESHTHTGLVLYRHGQGRKKAEGHMRGHVLLPTSAVWAQGVAGFHTCLWGTLDPSDCVLMTVYLRVWIRLSIISQI